MQYHLKAGFRGDLLNTDCASEWRQSRRKTTALTAANFVRRLEGCILNDFPDRICCERELEIPVLGQ